MTVPQKKKKSLKTHEGRLRPAALISMIHICIIISRFPYVFFLPNFITIAQKIKILKNGGFGLRAVVRPASQISKIREKPFLTMSRSIHMPKYRFIGLTMWPVAWSQTNILYSQMGAAWWPPGHICIKHIYIILLHLI